MIHVYYALLLLVGPGANHIPLAIILQQSTISQSIHRTMYGNISRHYSTASDEETRVLVFNILRSATASLYFLIFVLGVGGNVAACYIISHRPKHTATTIFLINLSVADLMMAFFCVPVTLISDCLLLRWVFGIVMCHVFPFVQGLSVFLGALTHVAISLDRYFVVFHPLRRQNFPLLGATVIMFFVWTFSVVASTPMAIVANFTHGYNNESYCRESWRNPKHAVIYSFVVLVFQYFLPLFVIVLSYSAIAIRMWFHHQPGESIRARDEAITVSKRKMIKMFILVAVFYSLSQLPRHIIVLVSFSHDSDRIWNEYTIWIMNSAHLLSMSACFYNPLLYIWLNATFRRKFRGLLSCKTAHSQSVTGDRPFTFQDNPMMMRRLLSISCNNMIVSKQVH